MSTSPVSTLPRYVLDANVLIQAARQYYAFDLAPTFWDALIEHAASGRLESIDRVKAEIDRGNDALKDWTRHNFHQWFASTDEDDVIHAYRQLMGWAYGQSQFSDAAKAEFARQENADAWLVAYAKAKGCVVVTDELFNPNVRRKIPIPNACDSFDVQHLGTFDMLRALQVRLG